jgi:hypothetical protein
MTTERANRLTGGHRWNEANQRCVVCLMSRSEFDEAENFVRASIAVASHSTCPGMMRHR